MRKTLLMFVFALSVSFIIPAVIGASGKGCTDPAAFNYDPSATVDNDTCDYGVSLYTALLPKIQNYMQTAEHVNGTGVVDGQVAKGINGVVSWLNSQKMKGGVLISKTSVPIVKNEFGRLYNGHPGEVIKPKTNFGYERFAKDPNEFIYQQLGLKLAKGAYYVRPVSWTTDMYTDYTLGEEMKIEIK